MLHHKQTFYHLKEKAYFLFAICSKSPQRNSIFIRYNKGAVREDRFERAPPKDLQTQARMIAANAAPLKHCPPPMRGNSQRRWTDYQTPPDSRKCLGVHHTDRQHRFLLLSTVAACLFVFPLLRQSAKKARNILLRAFWCFGEKVSAGRAGGRREDGLSGLPTRRRGCRSISKPASDGRRGRWHSLSGRPGGCGASRTGGRG